jgi:hypothetical protein
MNTQDVELDSLLMAFEQRVQLWNKLGNEKHNLQNLAQDIYNLAHSGEGLRMLGLSTIKFGGECGTFGNAGCVNKCCCNGLFGCATNVKFQQCIAISKWSFCTIWDVNVQATIAFLVCVCNVCMEYLQFINNEIMYDILFIHS